MGEREDHSIALFGATGNLGRALLRELPEAFPDARWRVFARSTRHREGRERARDAVRTAVGDRAEERASYHTADLSAPGLGLSSDDARMLAECRWVVNTVANVRFDLPLHQARADNVDTVRNLLACLPSTDTTIHHTSTAFVGQGSGVLAPHAVDASRSFRNTYERSKAESEAVLLSSRHDVVIHRPSIIVGSSTDGRTVTYDTLYPLARALVDGHVQALMAHPDHRLDIVPSDHVARCLLRLAADGYREGIYHLTAGQDRATSVRELVETLHDELRSMNHPQAATCDIAALRVLPQALLARIRSPMPGVPPPRRLAAVLRGADHLKPYLLGPDVLFDSTETERAVGVRAPSFTRYAPQLWRYAVEDGFGSRRRPARPSRQDQPASDLAELVRRAARTQPDALALQYGGRRLTFGDLCAALGSGASQLASHGAVLGTPVAVWPTGTMGDIVALLAATASGAEVHLLLPGQPPARSTALTICAGTSGRVRVTRARMEEARTPGVVMATSGTTGAPTWIRHTPEALPWCGAIAARTLGVESRHKVGMSLPLFHAYATGVVLPTAWHSGAGVVLLPEEPRSSLEAIADARVTHVVGVVDTFQGLADSIRVSSSNVPDISAWEMSLCGDEPLLPTTWTGVEETLSRPLALGYGSTETLLVGIAKEPRPAREGMVVRALAGTTTTIAPSGVDTSHLVGEVVVRQPWPTPTGTRRAGTGNEVMTGDRGFVDDDGQLHVLGRMLPRLRVDEAPDGTDAVARKLEIEDVVLNRLQARRAHTVWLQGRPLTLVEAAGDQKTLEVEVSGQRVSVVHVDQLPRTPVGKVSSRAVDALLRDTHRLEW